MTEGGNTTRKPLNQWLNMLKWESVRGCVSGLERLDYLHVCQLAKAKYYLRITKRGNNVIRDVFWAHSIYSFSINGVLASEG